MACYICGTNVAIEEHHLVLQAEGGTKGKTIDLCSTHHTMCHQQARAYQSKNAKTRSKNYVPIALYHRAKPIIEAIIEGRLTYNTEKEKFQDYAIQNVNIPISPRQLVRLHTLKQRQGFDNLEKFLMAVMRQMTGVAAKSKDELPPGAEF
jgi:hypothetical protein